MQVDAAPLPVPVQVKMQDHVKTCQNMSKYGKKCQKMSTDM